MQAAAIASTAARAPIPERESGTLWRRFGAAGASLAVHAVLIGGLMVRPEAEPPEPLLVRLVFADPPPPPLAAVTADPVTPPVENPKPTVTAKRKPKPVVPPAAETVERPAAVVPDEPAPPPPAVASAEGGVLGGEAGGVAGGIVGGRVGAPIPAGRVAHPPRLVKRVDPKYPQIARRRGIKGLVRLEAVLDDEGRIEEPIRVVLSIPALDDAAIAALRDWRFTPARDASGEPVRVILEVPIDFVLR